MKYLLEYYLVHKGQPIIPNVPDERSRNTYSYSSFEECISCLRCIDTKIWAVLDVSIKAVAV